MLEDGGRQEGVAGGHDGGGRKKDEGDEEGEAEGRRPASRTKTQVHIQGDVGRCPGVTSIKDGLPSTDGGDGGPETHYTSSLYTFPYYTRLNNHYIVAANFSIRLHEKD